MPQKPWPQWTQKDTVAEAPKPWPRLAATQVAVVECGQEIKSSQAVVATQTQQQLPATVDRGHNAGVEYEIDSAEVVPFNSVITIAPQERVVGKPFQKGIAPNPNGRPKGSKHKITELARSIVAEDFAEHGKATLARVRLIDPVSYLQLVLKFVPRELILQREQGHCIDYGALTDKEFAEVLEEATKRGKYERMLQVAVDVAQGKL